MTMNHHFNRVATDVTGNVTLTAADSGKLFIIKADGVVVTLPSTALGLTYTFVNGSRYDGEYGYAVSPAAADGFTGNGFTAAINKDAVVSKTTGRARDEMRIFGTGTAGVTGWTFQQVQGTVTREA